MGSTDLTDKEIDQFFSNFDNWTSSDKLTLINIVNQGRKHSDNYKNQLQECRVFIGCMASVVDEVIQPEQIFVKAKALKEKMGW